MIRQRELIKERTVAGLAAARKKGGIGSGQKSALTPDKLDTARKLLAAGDKPAKVAKLLQVGLSTFYRHFPASEPVHSSFARTGHPAHFRVLNPTGRLAVGVGACNHRSSCPQTALFLLG